MFKHSLVIIGLGLSLGLTACSQSAEAPQVKQTKPVSTTAKKSTKPKANAETGKAREPRKLPKAVYAACENLEAKSACTVETQRGTREGVCRTTTRGEERLACLPSRPKGTRPRPSGQ